MEQQMALHYILMADVVGSHSIDSQQLQANFKKLVAHCNESIGEQILSPFTITLGDEFQGVAKSLKGVLESIFYLEENGIRRGYDFKLRYIAHYGEIQTKLNRKIAYEMLGPGLTFARGMLSDKRRDRPRFLFMLENDYLSNNLNRLGKILESLTDRWKVKDFPLISEMLSNHNNKEVGLKHKKNRSQVWKRRKQLFIEEYQLLKSSIFDLEKINKRDANL
jgi:hypothetical protein